MKKLFLMIMLSLPFIAACSDDDNEMKVDLSNAVTEFIDTRYPGAGIRASEFEKSGLLEVEILHDDKVKDVYFDSKNEWVYTSWDVRKADLPEIVAAAVTEAYPDYRIDEIDFIEREERNYYAIELEKHGTPEIIVNVTPEGEILD